ncbi:MAG: hypothetical protein PHP14_03465 [Candidatus Pacebacteria bacterium]|nr:hypothetical protein [Candidatus Paceibacterota bacterium]MDD3808337.1 hypothetical protein [Candidatus Paceibacterota bacterium]
MIGTVNTDTSKCETSMGSSTQANCINTYDISEASTATPSTST